LLPADATYFATVPVTEINQTSGTFASFCIPADYEYEVWAVMHINFAVLQTLNSLQLIIADTGEVIAEDRAAPGKTTFNLIFYAIEDSDTTLSIAYTGSPSFSNSFTNENGFTWGYRLFGLDYSDAVVNSPTPCPP